MASSEEAIQEYKRGFAELFSTTTQIPLSVKSGGIRAEHYVKLAKMDTLLSMSACVKVGNNLLKLKRVDEVCSPHFLAFLVLNLYRL